MIFRKLYRIFYRDVICARNPVKYAQKIGVNIGGRIRIYGKIGWSTEPWLITLGDNVHITNGVRFICHDGGTLLFRTEYLIWRLQSQ